MVFSFRLFAVRALASLLCFGFLTLGASPDTQATASVVTGMNAYWNFNEPGGTTAANSGTAGATLDGTLLGSIEFVEGLFGNAVSFPGDGTAYVRVDNQVITDAAAAYTISTWLKPAEIPRIRQVIFESGPRYALSAGIRADTSYIQHYVEVTPGSNPTTYVTEYELTEDRWHHLAVTYTHDADMNQGTSKVYIDGAEYPNARLTSEGVLRDTTFFNIGRHRSHPDGHPFYGLADDMAIWDGRTLSDSEIAGIAGLGRFSGIDLGKDDQGQA